MHPLAEAEAEGNELDKLQRDLFKALAEEEKIIHNINRLENCIKTEQFNDVTDLNMSSSLGRNVAHIYDVQNRKDSSTKPEFLEHILDKHISDLDTLLSGVEFKAQQINNSPNSIGYRFTIESRQVKYFLQFLWLENSKSVKHTQVEFPSEVHGTELAPFVRTLARQNNVHKIVRVVTEYSEAFEDRKKILKELVRQYRSTFQYELSENGGYDFEISDQSTGKKFLEATWKIDFFKKGNKMDHCFSFNVDEDLELDDDQREIFDTLTKGSDDSSERLNIRELISKLIRGFSRLQE